MSFLKLSAHKIGCLLGLATKPTLKMDASSALLWLVGVFVREQLAALYSSCLEQSATAVAPWGESDTLTYYKVFARRLALFYIGGALIFSFSGLAVNLCRVGLLKASPDFVLSGDPFVDCAINRPKVLSLGFLFQSIEFFGWLFKNSRLFCSWDLTSAQNLAFLGDFNSWTLSTTSLLHHLFVFTAVVSLIVIGRLGKAYLANSLRDASTASIFTQVALASLVNGLICITLLMWTWQWRRTIPGYTPAQCNTAPLDQLVRT